jgi:hypothetical protein
MIKDKELNMSHQSADHTVDATIAIRDVKDRLCKIFETHMHGVTAVHDQCAEDDRKMVIRIECSTRAAKKLVDQFLPATVCGDWQIETHLSESSHDPDMVWPLLVPAGNPVLQP